MGVLVCWWAIWWRPKRVLTWIPSSQHQETKDPFYCFKIEHYDKFDAIKSCLFDRYLYVGMPELNDKRKLVLTWMPNDGGAPENDEDMQFKIEGHELQ